jgi:hypothetical protein
MTHSKAIPNRSFRKLAAVLATTASALALCAAARAQLPTGEWTGTITPPEGAAEAVTFTVGEAGGELQISFDVGGVTFDFRDIQVTDDAINFTWNPGIDVHCQLDLQEDSSYAGPCTDTNGDTGHIAMVPPA